MMWARFSSGERTLANLTQFSIARSRTLSWSSPLRALKSGMRSDTTNGFSSACARLPMCFDAARRTMGVSSSHSVLYSARSSVFESSWPAPRRS